MPNSIHPDVRIGHVHLKVADLDRALRFYRDLLGFELTQRYGKEAAFLSAGGYHHHIGLNIWESNGAGPRTQSLGLVEFEIVVPDQTSLDEIIARLESANCVVEDNKTKDPWGTHILLKVQ